MGKEIKKTKRDFLPMAHLSRQPLSWQEMDADQLFGSCPPDSSLCRYRMEMDLRKAALTKWPSLPPGFQCSNWKWSDCEDFATVLYRSFVDSPDAQIIPSFRTWEGCQELARVVAQNGYFLPSATLLIRDRNDPVGCIQVMGCPDGKVNIQNIGIVPNYRRLRLGNYLLARALSTVQKWGLGMVGLEVTADNAAALALYQRFGFVRVSEVWKPVVPLPRETREARENTHTISIPAYPVSPAGGSDGSTR